MSAPTSAPARSAPFTPADVVERSGPMRVYRYRTPEGALRRPVPVVLVPSIINRPWVFDLREGQSLAAHLLGRGLDVYLVDWGAPTGADARLDLGDYGLRLIRRVLRAVRRESGAPRAHLLGYCLGGTFGLIAAARRVAGVASVVALTTPVDLAEPGGLGLLTDARLLDLERVAAAFPIVPGPAIWAAFQLLDPVGNAGKWRLLSERGRDDPEFVARFVAKESWLSDPIPMTARALRGVVDDLYRRNALARGELVLRGAPVRLEDGRAPVLNLIARKDTIVPPAASRPLAELWGGPVETREFSGGHIGVCVGSRAPQQMWRAAAEWLTARQE